MICSEVSDKCTAMLHHVNNALVEHVYNATEICHCLNSNGNISWWTNIKGSEILRRLQWLKLTCTGTRVKESTQTCRNHVQRRRKSSPTDNKTNTCKEPQQQCVMLFAANASSPGLTTMVEPARGTQSHHSPTSHHEASHVNSGSLREFTYTDTMAYQNQFDEIQLMTCQICDEEFQFTYRIFVSSAFQCCLKLSHLSIILLIRIRKQKL